jgi:hypothetical protein
MKLITDDKYCLINVIILNFTSNKFGGIKNVTNLVKVIKYRPMYPGFKLSK